METLLACPPNHPSDSGLDEPSVSTISRVALAIAIVASLVSLLLLVFLMAHGVPIAEDYGRARVGWRNALFYANVRYLRWTGRWTSMALESFLLSAFNPYHSIPIILLALFALRFLALTYLLRKTLELSVVRSMFWSMLLISAWIAVSPGLSDAHLWATGAMEYELPLSLALFALALVIQSKWITALPFLVVAATMHELVALALTGMFASLLWMRRRNRKSTLALAWLTLLAAGLTAFVVLAPGNAIRAARLHGQTHNVFAISASLLHLVSGTVNWTVAGTTAGLLLLAGARGIPRRAGPELLDLIGWPLLFSGLMASAALIPFAFVPTRVLDLLCFIYLLLLFYGAVRLAPQLDMGGSVRVVGLLLFSVGLMASRNFKEMVVSAKEAPAWNRALQERENSHRFEALPWPPSYFQDADITSDSNNWLNQCVAEHLGMEFVSCPSCRAPASATATLPPE